MSKIAVNKKQTKFNLILISFLFIFFLIFIFTSLFWLNYTNFKLNVLSNYIEAFSKKYDYLLTEVEISGLNNISEVEINRYFEKYYNKSIFLVSLKEISQNIENFIIHPPGSFLVTFQAYNLKVSLGTEHYIDSSSRSTKSSRNETAYGRRVRSRRAT